MRHRIDQRLYKQFLKASFPAIFPDIVVPTIPRWWASSSLLDFGHHNVPVPAKRLYRYLKGGALRSRHGRPVSKMHVDLDHQFHTYAKFRDFCTQQIEDLHKRDAMPWLNLPQLLDRARRDAAGLGRPLYGLASLEINFKVGQFGKPHQ